MVKMGLLHCFALILAMSLWSPCNSQNPCPALYRRYSQTHTYCLPPNATCQIIKRDISADEKQQILRIHNERRSRVATGQETTGNLPQAADMLQMVWDDELAAVAQKHADQCVMDHDCSECREVQNFRTGQNLAQSWTSSQEASPNWEQSINGWYNEVNNFKASIVDSFGSQKGNGVIGHFTQVIWARSWKIGCGYTLYPDQGKMYQLYTCNYGPGGNIRNAPVYIRGNSGSQCPQNSCYGSSCGGQPVYPGLCQVSTDQHPVYTPQGQYIFYCDFETDCGVSTSSDQKSWDIVHTLSGSFASVVLKGGESSTLKFTNVIKAVPTVCISVMYRKGPNVSGQRSNNEAVRIFHSVEDGSDTESKLQQDQNAFFRSGISLSFNEDLEFAVRFSAPAGTPEQYFDITNVFAKEGKC